MTESSNRPTRSVSARLLSAGLIAMTLVVGCRSMDRQSEQALAQAESELKQRPQAALSKLNRVLERYPELQRARRARAEAYELLGQPYEARQDWQNLLLDPELDSSLRPIALSHFGQLTLTLVGPLPDRVVLGERVLKHDVRTGLEEAQTAFRELLALDPEDPSALFGLASCQYRLGNLAGARSTLNQLQKLRQTEGMVTFLSLLVRESLAGATEDLIREYGQLAAKSDEALLEGILLHLIYISKADSDNRRVLLAIQDMTQSLERDSKLSAKILERLTQRRREFAREQELSEAQNAARAARRAKSRNDYATAWELWQQTIAITAEFDEEIERFLGSWCENQIAQLYEALRYEQLDRVESIWQRLGSLPQERIPPAQREKLADLAAGIDELLVAKEVEGAFEQVRELLSAEEALAAVELLDRIEPKVAAEKRKYFDVLRAEALAAWGKKDEALALFDSLKKSGVLKEFIESSSYRVYGILLLEEGRAEEAQAVLENLPLNLFTSEAFHALIMSLREQEEWEAILGRLQTLTVIPTEYRPILIEATSQAAYRRLRGGNPDGAYALLKAYLSDRDFQEFQVQEVYLLILVELGEIDRVADLIVKSDPKLFRSMPKPVLYRVRDRALNQFEGEAQFRLLSHLSDLAGTDATEAELQKLWPRYGSYLPKPGDYTLTYQVQNFVQGKSQSYLDETWQLSWQDNRFVAELNSRRTEIWQESNGVLELQNGSEIRFLPVNIDGSPPYRVVQYSIDRVTWSAQIVDSGLSLTVKGRAFSGCQKIKVTNEADPGEFKIHVVAPHYGIIRTEEHTQGSLVRVKELRRLAKIKAVSPPR